MSMNNLQEVLVDLLKDTFHAEKQLVKALPQMAKAADNEDLRSAFEDHLQETENHVNRLEQAFSMLNMKPAAKTCHGMMGLVEEGKEVIDEKKSGHPAAIDAALIAAAQKVEHYEISAYGTLVTFAEMLGLEDLANLLKETLNEEEKADDTLSDIAESSVNAQAVHAGQDEDGDTEVSEPRSSRKSSAAGARGKRS